MTGIYQAKLSFISRIRLNLFLTARKVFGAQAAIIILEMIEIYGIKKYFDVWKQYQNSSLVNQVKEILRDEFSHEEKAITEGAKRKIISTSKIKNAILGFNDGFVEILGALGGFLAAFGDYLLVGISGLVVGVAGSISMASSAFLSAKTEREITEIEEGKEKILQEIEEKEYVLDQKSKENPLTAGFYVGLSYILGALIPVSPFIFGAKSIFWPILISITVIFFLSWLTAFFARESFLKRLKSNSIIIVGAILITYSISYLVKRSLNIEI